MPIAKTHCIYWPIMLKVLGLPLFGKIRVHGHWLGEDGRKMSKSRGNGVDPVKVISEYGSDPFRYYLAKNMTKTDSLMGYGLIDACYHADLVNNISNAVYRVLKMVKKNCPDELRIPAEFLPEDESFLDRIFQLAEAAVNQEPELENIRGRTSRILDIASLINSYISEAKPWLLTRPEDAQRLDGLLATLLEAVRLMTAVAWPIMPDNSKRTFELLDCPEIRPFQKRFFRNGHHIGEPFIAFMRKAKTEKIKKD